ncbi:hypothetical protein [Streptomyces lannensis]|uniref:Uncharacterized protein n=1 Tax=Streptomyces lannensis TaxID=766498 RepID=A0ABP7LIC1_9ACTN
MATKDTETLSAWTVYQEGGQYNADHDSWWSNNYQHWFPVNYNNCLYAEVEVADKGMKLGSSLFLNLLGTAGNYGKFEFELIARGPRGSWVDETSPQFVLMLQTGDRIGAVDSISHRSEAEDARRALQALHRNAVYHGWIPQQQRGFHWYSYAYTLPLALKPDDWS